MSVELPGLRFPILGDCRETVEQAGEIMMYAGMQRNIYGLPGQYRLGQFSLNLTIVTSIRLQALGENEDWHILIHALNFFTLSMTRSFNAALKSVFNLI